METATEFSATLDDLETLATEISAELRSAGAVRLVWRDSALAAAASGLTRGTLANLDSMGGGPADRLRIGARAAYPIASFARWLAARELAARRKRIEGAS